MTKNTNMVHQEPTQKEKIVVGSVKSQPSDIVSLIVMKSREVKPEVRDEYKIKPFKIEDEENA